MAVETGTTVITPFTGSTAFTSRGTIPKGTNSWGLHSAAPGGVWYWLVTTGPAPTAVTEMVPMAATDLHYVRDGDTIPIGEVYLHDAGAGAWVIEKQ